MASSRRCKIAYVSLNLRHVVTSKFARKSFNIESKFFCDLRNWLHACSYNLISDTHRCRCFSTVLSISSPSDIVIPQFRLSYSLASWQRCASNTTCKDFYNSVQRLKPMLKHSANAHQIFRWLVRSDLWALAPWIFYHCFNPKYFMCYVFIFIFVSFLVLFSLVTIPGFIVFSSHSATSLWEMYYLKLPGATIELLSSSC